VLPLVQVPLALNVPAPLTVDCPSVVAPPTASVRLLANCSVAPVSIVRLSAAASALVISALSAPARRTVSSASGTPSASAAGTASQVQLIAVCQSLPLAPTKLQVDARAASGRAVKRTAETATTMAPSQRRDIVRRP
jgi:hypothetical protein